MDGLGIDARIDEQRFDSLFNGLLQMVGGLAREWLGKQSRRRQIVARQTEEGGGPLSVAHKAAARRVRSGV